MFHTSSILVKVQRQITAFTIKMQSEADKEQSVLKLKKKSFLCNINKVKIIFAAGFS